MASNINRMVNFENPLTINAKNTTTDDQTHQRKMALGDIKNAPIGLEKPPAQMIDAKATMDASIEAEYAYSKFVDYLNVWTDELALSDDEVYRWAIASMQPYDDEDKPLRPPSPPQSPFDDIPFPVPDFDSIDELVPPPLPEISSEPGSPASDSSMYYSLDDSCSDVSH